MGANELSPCRITKDNVIIGGVTLPDYIVQNSVFVEPGGVKDVNRVHVTFMVGEIICEDPWPLQSG